MSIRKSGYQFASPNPEAKVYSPTLDLTPPRKVDLRRHMTPVEDQGPLQSCTANAIAGAYEYLIKKHTGAHVDLSRLFIYYNARWRNGEQREDCGSVIQYGMESLQSFGACDETVWPYEPTAVLDKPKKPIYTAAEKFRVLDMQKVNVTLDHWRQCLAEGYPIVFGCALFESFDDCNSHHGVVPMPDPKAVARGEHGRHAMLCVGYSDVDKVFIVRNSWGADWGDGGYCYMPYNYLMSEKLNGGDCWMLRGEDQLPDPSESWIADDRPLLRHVDHARINSYLATAYDWIELSFFGGDDDFHYSSDLIGDYVEFYESIESEFTYIEESESYVSFETEEESEEIEEEESEEETEEESEEEEEDEESEEEEDDEEEEEDEEDEEDEDEDEGEEDEDDEESEDEEEDDSEDDDSDEDDDGDDDESDDDDDDGDDDDSGDDDDGGDDDSGDDDE
ncbi:MAG: C1 family peptidase [Methylocystis sp.]|uniref:C1 family peptidase n=1 Tax=Methylocystis sp. TaxID=1911079 RepID=UPI003DA2AC04